MFNGSFVIYCKSMRCKGDELLHKRKLKKSNMREQNSFRLKMLLIFAVSLVVFSVGLGHVHLFDWDEINFAENAREMLATGDYLTVRIDYQPFWEKPPLFIWSQVLSMKIFGVNEFASRFPNALIGAIVLSFLFFAGKKLQSEKFAWLWVMTYAGSLLPFFYFKSGIIDPWFNFFIFLGIYYFFRYVSQKQSRGNAALSALFVGLSVLTKGPVGFLIYFLTVVIFLIVKKSLINVKFRDLVIFSVILLLVGGFWYILLIINGKFELIKEFLIYQVRLLNTKDAGHGGFLFYHFFILFFGVFPASIFALRGLFKFNEAEKTLSDFTQIMKILFWVVLILFTIVKTKIVHYSSMCYYPITYLAARVIYKLMSGEMQWQKFYGYLIVGIGVVLGLLVASLPLVSVFKTEIISSGIIKDKFAESAISADIKWSFSAYLIGGTMIVFSIISVIYSKAKYNYFGVKMIFLGTIIFTTTTMFSVVPTIEKYSQNAMIEFYKQKSQEDCYVDSFFKSYARLFYFNKQQWQSEYTRDELLQKKIDKPVYFVGKIDKKDGILKKYPQIYVLYEKNGYVFYGKRQ